MHRLVEVKIVEDRKFLNRDKDKVSKGRNDTNQTKVLTSFHCSPSNSRGTIKSIMFRHLAKGVVFKDSQTAFQSFKT